MRTRKNFFKDYYDKPKIEDTPVERFCEAPGCTRPGTYKAPKSRQNIREHRWFCEQHIQEYNAKWDYLEGLSPEEIEKEIRADIFWRRPSWSKLKTFKASDLLGNADVFGFFEDVREENTQRRVAHESPVPENLAKALKVMDVKLPITLKDVKKIYKDMAKRYHPDVNGGSKEAEEKLKSINIAMGIIEEYLQSGKA